MWRFIVCVIGAVIIAAAAGAIGALIERSEDNLLGY